MTDENKQSNPQASADGIQGALQRFNELPPPAKYALIGVAVFFVIMILGRFTGGSPAPRRADVVSTVNVPQIQQEGDVPRFEVIETERDSLMRNFVSQQQLALQGLRDTIDNRMSQKEEELSEIQRQILEQTNKLDEMIKTFEVQIQSMQEDNSQFREEMSRLAEESRREGVRQGMGVGDVPQRRRQRVSQTPLGSGGGVTGGQGRPLLPGLVSSASGGNINLQTGVAGATRTEVHIDPPLPFMPPLGFIKGTLLNGVDALAGAGVAAPALVRLSGSYKTAMNSTVNLDGCFMLVEFEGEVSTERALGKPSQMTCVYPDRGAVTYSVTGYIVDAKDGIVGVPGVFYEGDPSRIATAFAAEFIAGVANVIRENQTTTTTNVDGNSQRVLTGNQATSEIAGGVDSAVSSLRDYLMERVERVQSFIRIDSTRDIHIVMLSGVELRENGNPWTLLFDGEAADAALRQAKQAQEQARSNNASDY